MNIGGQAVIEGVLIMSPDKYAIAVRDEKGKLRKKVEKHVPVSKRYKLLSFPVVRGFANLVDMLVVGTNALTWSAEQQGEEQLKGWETFITFAAAILLTIGIFVVLPYYAARLFLEPPGLLFNIVDGVFRLLAFFLYLVVIGLFSDVRRMFQYHGAEHMSVHCYEAGDKLTPSNCLKHRKEHARCGTSLLFFVVIVSIFVFSLLHTPFWYINIAGRILLIPVVAGISYELLKFSAKYKWLWWVSLPGIWTQKLTTKRPDKKQLEVAIAAVKEVV